MAARRSDNGGSISEARRTPSEDSALSNRQPCRGRYLFWLWPISYCGQAVLPGIHHGSRADDRGLIEYGTPRYRWKTDSGSLCTKGLTGPCKRNGKRG